MLTAKKAAKGKYAVCRILLLIINHAAHKYILELRNRIGVQ